MSNLNPLFESAGEYPDIDDLLNHWYNIFRISWRKFKATFGGLGNSKELPKESAMVCNILKGLNIKVYAYPDSDRNAFVIPGYYVGSEKQAKELYKEYRKRFPNHSLFSIYRGDFYTWLLSKQLDQLLLMRKFNITDDPKHKGKKIAVFKNVTTPISIFTTYGMLNHATPEERVAVYLHEFGHWIDTARSIPQAIIDRPETESCYLFYTNCIKRWVTRYEELEADKFAKTLGYGEELAQALDGLVSVRKQISWIYRWGDYMIKKSVAEHNAMEKAGETTPMYYPSMDTRKKYLRDDK